MAGEIQYLGVGEFAVIVGCDFVSGTQRVQPPLRAVRHQYGGIPRHAHDNNNAAAWGQTSLSGRGIPVLDCLANRLRLRVLEVFDRIVDDQNVRAEAADAPAYASALDPTLRHRLPALSAGGLLVELYVGEDDLVSLLRHPVAVCLRKLQRQTERVGGHDDFEIRAFTKRPAREVVGYELAIVRGNERAADKIESVGRRHLNAAAKFTSHSPNRSDRNTTPYSEALHSLAVQARQKLFVWLKAHSKYRLLPFDATATYCRRYLRYVGAVAQRRCQIHHTIA